MDIQEFMAIVSGDEPVQWAKLGQLDRKVTALVKVAVRYARSINGPADKPPSLKEDRVHMAALNGLYAVGDYMIKNKCRIRGRGHK